MDASAPKQIPLEEALADTRPKSFPPFNTAPTPRMVKPGSFTQPKPIKIRVGTPKSKDRTPSPDLQQSQLQIPRVTDAEREQKAKFALYREAGAKKYFTEMYKSTLQEMDAEEILKLFGQEAYAMRQAHDELQNKKSEKSYAMFITVNASPGTTLEQLQKQVDKYVNKKPFQQVTRMWTYERRWSEEATWEGYHCHLLIVCPVGKKPAEIKRETQSTFKGICSVTNSHCLNIKYIPLDQYEARVAYITGTKKQEKQEWVLLDQQWRDEVGLQQYYKSSPGEDEEETE